VEIFDPLSPAMLNNPYPVYQRLRAEDPAHWHEGLNAWVISRHEDCSRIMSDHETFRSDFRNIGEEMPEEALGLQTLDRPEHGVIRHIVLSAMRGTDFDAWLAASAETADKMLDSFGESEFDFVTDFAEPLVAQGMAELFGVPLLDEEGRFISAQRDLVLSMDSGLDPRRYDAGMSARRYLTGLIEPWINDPPSSGLLSRVDFDSAGPALGHLVNSLRAVFVAGYSSSGSMLGNAVRVLCEHGFLDRDEPIDFNSVGFHELLRFEGAVQAESRAVYEPATVGDRTIDKGSVLVLLVGSANRDESVFPDADKILLDRTANPHLGFGKGVHACVGGRVALMLGIGIIRRLTRTFRVELTAEPVQRPSATLRGLDELKVCLKRR
jgi:cytochrome P450